MRFHLKYFRMLTIFLKNQTNGTQNTKQITISQNTTIVLFHSLTNQFTVNNNKAAEY